MKRLALLLLPLALLRCVQHPCGGVFGHHSTCRLHGKNCATCEAPVAQRGEA